MRRQYKSMLILLLLILVSVGCGKKTPVRGADDRAQFRVQGSQGSDLGRNGQQNAERSMAKQEDLLNRRRVYFEFDSSVLDARSRAIVGAHARYLKAHPAITLTLEGHADERGTREYNLALGQRRAEAVSMVLKEMGIRRARIGTVSYGEEQPAALGHTEASWHLNRRVEILYYK